MNRAKPYKRKPTQAQTTSKRARNDQTHSPINSLPAEVLTQIFFLVLNEETCLLRKRDIWESEPKNKPYFPAYPDLLSHVCSRWRQIALGCPKLWSHIDITLSCSRSKGFHDRAATYASRAHPAPLDIHFIDPGRIAQAERGMAPDNDSEEEDCEFDPDNFIESVGEGWYDWVWNGNPSTFAILSSPISRIRSLGLIVHERQHPLHSRVLEHCLANCLPEGLSKLAIDLGTPFNVDTFFKVRANLVDQDTTDLVLPEQQLERVLRSITILRLKRVCFPWTSVAYHGLTDLRLLGNMRISVSELTGILKSSPKLHTIHCGLAITDSPGSSAPTTTVTLQELEVLELGSMLMEWADRLITLLNPGPKPLRVSISSTTISTSLRTFFARSNIQELRIGGHRSVNCRKFPPDPLSLPPRLRVLVMSQWNWGSSTENTRVYPPMQLDTLYMLGCRYGHADQFRKAVAQFLPRKLVIQTCFIASLYSATPLSTFRSALGEDLSQSCSIEYLTDKDPDPFRENYEI